MLFLIIRVATISYLNVYFCLYVITRTKMFYLKPLESYDLINHK